MRKKVEEYYKERGRRKKKEGRRTEGIGNKMRKEKNKCHDESEHRGYAAGKKKNLSVEPLSFLVFYKFVFLIMIK